MMPKCQVGWRVDERPRWPTWTITRLPDRRQMRRWCRPIREGTHPRLWLTCGRATRTACTGAGSTSRRVGPWAPADHGRIGAPRRRFGHPAPRRTSGSLLARGRGRLRSAPPAEGTEPPHPSAPPSTWRKPPATLGIRPEWRPGIDRLPGRSGHGSSASGAETAARITGQRPACPGPSRWSRSTSSRPPRCRTCARASCARRAAAGEPPAPVSPFPNRATPTAHLSPVGQTRYRPRGPSRAFIHPPPDLAFGHHEGRRMPRPPPR